MNLTIGSSGDTLVDDSASNLTYSKLSSNCSDLGNGIRFSKIFGETVRFCNTSRKWYIWNGEIWRKDENQEINRLANEVILAIYSEAEKCIEEETRQKLFRWAKTSESLTKRNSMIGSAQPYLSVTSDKWDKDINLFNCKNGTFELDTGIFREHRKEDYITKRSGVTYNPDAECPVWKEHISLIFNDDEELIEAFQMMSGYTLLGDNPEQAFFILFGSGMNGKTVTQRIISDILGDYAINVSPDTLMKRYSSGGNARSDIVRLKGSRFISSGEGDEGDILSEKLIKLITGGDTITARNLYESESEISVGGKIWFATNHKPTIKGTDYAIWRRVWLIPFNVTIPIEIRDSKIPEKLHAEVAGIFNWMIEGLQNYYDNSSRLTKPTQVQAATEKYRTESDLVGEFINDCYIIDLDNLTWSVKKTDLRDRFEQWCEETDEQELSKKAFTQKLQERGFQQIKGRREWAGLRLKDSSD